MRISEIARRTGASRPPRTARISGPVGAALIALCLAGGGCGSPGPGFPAAVSPAESPTESRSLVLRGLQALRADDAELASNFVNAALKLDVQNSQLQMLNGLVYHLRAVRSDSTLFELAEEGYRLALQFDDSNWLARYYLGLLKLDRRRYREAQEVLAEAILFNDADPDLLYSFAAASYYARDPEAAAGALRRLREVESETPRAIRASSIVAASLGDMEEALVWKSRYTALPGAGGSDSLSRRLADWARFHARVEKALSTWPLSRDTGVVSDAGPVADRAQLAQFVVGKEGTEPGPNQPEATSNTESESGNAGPTPESEEEGENAADDAVSEASKPMVIVDVVIISSVEDNSTAKGVNLLNGLTLQFGSSANDAFSLTRNIVRDTASTGQAETTTIVRALTIPKITYSLNIANAGSNRNEILARPSLVATEGQKSEFFSGENIKASSVSKTSAEGTSSVDQDIGVKLAVTPEKVAKDNVEMLIEVERTFLQSPTSSVTFDFQIRTSKTNVAANVTLKRGETLILSGLSEKETENTRSGVPGLQEVPGLQYLFSRQTTRDFNRSVLVLVTPREPEYTFRPRNVKPGGNGGAPGQEEEEALYELKARYSDWFQPYPNWASVFHHLQNNRLYREFRTGDVELERWDTQATREARLNRLLDFLHY